MVFGGSWDDGYSDPDRVIDELNKKIRQIHALLELSMTTINGLADTVEGEFGNRQGSEEVIEKIKQELATRVQNETQT